MYFPTMYNVNEDAGTASVCVAIIARSAIITTMLPTTSTVTPSFLTGLGSASMLLQS